MTKRALFRSVSASEGIGGESDNLKVLLANSKITLI